MEIAARRDLEILTTLGEGRPVTQRALAQRLGIALGLSNLYLKRLIRKGYVKVTTLPPHRLQYLVTPRGVVHRTRLGYEYLRYSAQLYAQARAALREAFGPLARDGVKRVGLCGTGEAAELTYLTLRELGLEPVGVFDREAGGRFLGFPVQGVADIAAAECDRVVVASFSDPSPWIGALTRAGVSRAAIVSLRRVRRR